MPGAGRVGDQSLHGGVVTGPGVPTVLVGGQAAAVVGDLHSCPIPASSGHLPVSAFVAGSATVLVGGRPMLRVGDSAACGASEPVGAPLVMIG